MRLYVDVRGYWVEVSGVFPYRLVEGLRVVVPDEGPEVRVEVPRGDPRVLETTLRNRMEEYDGTPTADER